MLGLLLIYFIGKTYYSLAEEHKKEKLWLWAILGVIAYYGGGFILGIIVFLYWDLTQDYFDYESINKGTEILLGLVGGIIGTVGLYQFLKYRWNKVESREKTDDILDEGFLNDDDFSDNNFSINKPSSDDYLDDNK